MVEEKKTISIGFNLDKITQKIKEAKDVLKQRDKVTAQLDKSSKPKQNDNKAVSDQKKQYKEFLKKQKELKKNQSKIKKQLSEQDKLLSEAKNGILNPFDVTKNKLFGSLSKIIPLALVLKAVDLIFKRLEKEFGPGGRWDLRKLVKVTVTEYLSIKTRIKRLRGEIYFSSGNLSTVYQGAPKISNTVRKSDGHLRDILIDPGR